MRKVHDLKNDDIFETEVLNEWLNQLFSNKTQNSSANNSYTGVKGN